MTAGVSAQPLRGGFNKGNQDLEQILAEGKALAEEHCAGCHDYTGPELLDKHTWVRQTLPRMKVRVGLAPEFIDLHREAKQLKASGAFPTTPAMSEEVFNKIVKYYAAAAPAVALPQDPRPEITKDLKQFSPRRRSFRRFNPSTTLVKINEENQEIFLGHEYHKMVDVLSFDMERLRTLDIQNVPVAISLLEQHEFVTSIGTFRPSDIPRGDVTIFKAKMGNSVKVKTLIEGLPRPSGARFADLNDDKLIDVVVSKFGSNTGGLSWFENTGGGPLTEHVLIDKPGALPPVVEDFNDDGRPDIAVLIAQDWEMMFILTNEGDGAFSGDVAFKHHPLFGHSSFDMVDFNEDGLIDIIATNGDNGEYPSPTKKYHGIRVYLNQGENRFEESYFYPLNGAFRAIPRDFDEDGDLDIAAISFFPDYRNSPQESFVYLENHGDFKFTASTFGSALLGRWLVMDAGDLDGDKDIDLVLGSFIHGPSDVPDSLMQKWEEGGPSILVLENNLRQP